LPDHVEIVTKRALNGVAQRRGATAHHCAGCPRTAPRTAADAPGARGLRLIRAHKTGAAARWQRW
jgi:hypothetical protein